MASSLPTALDEFLNMELLNAPAIASDDVSGTINFADIVR